MKPYARVLSNYIGNDGVVEDVARQWDVPRWIIDDGLRGKTDAPSARYLSKVASGLNMTVDAFLKAIEEPRTEAAAAR